MCPLQTQSCQRLLAYSLQLHMQAYANHDVIAKLEAAGLEFGPCQNAYTGLEETVFELAVPTDDPDILRQALLVFREFAFKIRCSSEDLAKERGPVLEEWRQNRTAAGRAGEVHWQKLMQVLFLSKPICFSTLYFVLSPSQAQEVCYTLVT